MDRSILGELHFLGPTLNEPTQIKNTDCGVPSWVLASSLYCNKPFTGSRLALEVALRNQRNVRVLHQ